MRRISVGDIMTRNIIVVNPSASLHTCVKIMAKEGLDSLIIAIDTKLLGILTSGDIIRMMVKKPTIDLKKFNVMEIATKKLAVIKPSADLSQAINKMRSLNFRRLPVLSKGQLIGVLTLKDILAIAPQLYSESSSLMDEIREEERKVKQSEVDWPLEGLCDNCGAFSELLRVEGLLLCPDCRDELH
mgnify:CR=1 FL=1